MRRKSKIYDDENKIATIVPPNDINGQYSPSFLRELVEFEERGIRFILVDFSNVGSFTESGAGVLTVTSHDLGRIRGTLILHNVSERIQKKMEEISGFDLQKIENLLFCKDKEEALERCKKWI